VHFKCCFLLALATGRRRSELRALSVSEFCIRDEAIALTSWALTWFLGKVIPADFNKVRTGHTFFGPELGNAGITIILESFSDNWFLAVFLAYTVNPMENVVRFRHPCVGPVRFTHAPIISLTCAFYARTYY
jgi:hypothetical protein